MKTMKLFLSVCVIYVYHVSFCQAQYDSVSLTNIERYKEEFVEKTYFFKGSIVKKELYSRNDSILRFSSSYENDKLNGYDIEYWDSGELRIKIMYKNGIPVEEWKEWYKNGNLSYEVIFDDNFNTGISYYENGKIKSKEIMDSSFTLIGKCIYWCENGQVFKEVDFSQRQWDDYFTYYCNGQVQSEGKIIDHFFKTGKWTEYYEDGSIKLEGNYNHRKIGSQQPEFKVGIWNYYYPNKKKERIEKYTNEGKNTGVWEYYDKNGNLIKKQTPDARSMSE